MRGILALPSTRKEYSRSRSPSSPHHKHHNDRKNSHDKHSRERSSSTSYHHREERGYKQRSESKNRRKDSHQEYLKRSEPQEIVTKSIPDRSIQTKTQVVSQISKNDNF